MSIFITVKERISEGVTHMREEVNQHTCLLHVYVVLILLTSSYATFPPFQINLGSYFEKFFITYSTNH